MLDSDPGPFIKFWWKGVDIVVTVLSSTLSASIIAVLAALTWNWKKGRDLTYEREKKEQEHSLERERELARRRGRVQVMKSELGGFLYEVDQLMLRFAENRMTDIHIRIHAWLVSSGLALVGLNVRFEIDLRGLLPPSAELTQIVRPILSRAQLEGLANNLKLLEIPEPDNDGFCW